MYIYISEASAYISISNKAVICNWSCAVDGVSRRITIIPILMQLSFDLAGLYVWTQLNDQLLWHTTDKCDLLYVLLQGNL